MHATILGNINLTMTIQDFFCDPLSYCNTALWAKLVRLTDVTILQVTSNLTLKGNHFFHLKM